jgi:hypothetical protein
MFGLDAILVGLRIKLRAQLLARTIGRQEFREFVSRQYQICRDASRCATERKITKSDEIIPRLV